MEFALSKLVLLICCGFAVGQNDVFSRVNFNFQRLLSLNGTAQGNSQSGNLNTFEDLPSDCAAKPECKATADKFYYADGSCNNMIDGSRGQAGRPHKRLVPAAYADGKGQPRIGVNGRPLPSARLISTSMKSATTRKSTKNTHALVIFCQFITHDITNTPIINRDGHGVDCRCLSRDPACFNVEVPVGDRQIREEGKFCLPVVRSQPVPDANCNTAIRQQQNVITPYLDAGTVYGASDFQLGQLLDQNSTIGLLKTGNLAPFGISPRNAPSLPLVTHVHHTLREIECPDDVHKPDKVPCFVAGDVRANENPALASFHTLFVRMHNDLVTELNVMNRNWPKAQLINTARLIMSAVTQRIMYKEFLPEVLNPDYMKSFGLSVIDEAHYAALQVFDVSFEFINQMFAREHNNYDSGYWQGYDSSYDATTSTAFISAALRFGHTLVTSPLSRKSPVWTPQGSSMILKNSFFDSGPLLNMTFGGANSILRGLCDDAAETADTTFIDDLHNFLFAPAGILGHDLMAINLQRGRDHGIPGYNTYREFCGLKKANSFEDFVEIPASQRARLRTVYLNQVDDVDLYIAALAETPLAGGLFGPTFSCILAYQFRDIKKGDRLWHENGGEFSLFTPAQLESIRSYTMSRLICDSLSDTRSIQPNPFQLTSRAGNARRACRTYPRLNLNPWRETSTNPLNTDTTPEETAWFPADIDGTEFTITDLLAYLIANRPADVCEATLGSSERSVNGSKQYRYRCPPGSIRATDFPNVEASKGEWGPWVDTSTPGTDDDESQDPHRYCVEPIAIQVLTKANGTPARLTGEVFRAYSVSSGFVCRGRDQPNGRCQDYTVRYFCKRVVPQSDPVPNQPTSPSDMIWTAWSNLDNIDGTGDQELLVNVADTNGFCRNPARVEGRTAGSAVPANQTGDSIILRPRIGLVCLNHQQTRLPIRSRFCRNYEVRYLCRRSDIIGGLSNAPLPEDIQRQIDDLCNGYDSCCSTP